MPQITIIVSRMFHPALMPVIPISSRLPVRSTSMAMPAFMPGAWISGPAKYFDNFRPLAEAGPDQVATVTALPALIALDGSASSDPNGVALSYHWRQISGPAVTLGAAGTARAIVQCASARNVCI